MFVEMFAKDKMLLVKNLHVLDIRDCWGIVIHDIHSILCSYIVFKNTLNRFEINLKKDL